MNPRILEIAKEAGCTYWNDEEKEMDRPLERFYFLAQIEAFEKVKGLRISQGALSIDNIEAMIAQKREQAK